MEFGPGGLAGRSHSSVLSPRWVAAGHLQGGSSSSLLLTAPFWPRWSSCSSGRWWRTRRRPTAAAAAAHWSPRPTRRSTSRCTGSSRTSAAPTSGPSSERTSRSPSEPPPPLVAAVWVAPGRFGPITAPNSPFFGVLVRVFCCSQSGVCVSTEVKIATRNSAGCPVVVLGALHCSQKLLYQM